MKNRRKSAAPSTSVSSSADTSMWLTPAITILLVLLTVAAYWQVSRNDFVFFDDSAFILDNPAVNAGLTWEGFKWSLKELYVDYWHPLTWLSMMLDVQLFGLRAGGHHMVSLALHIISTLLLFHFLRYITHRQWLSAFVAALFAIHPLHVESVAWAAERKDVLSTLFCFATILAYVRYAAPNSKLSTQNSKLWQYLLVLLFFALGLLSKPMLVTLPVVLLLLDYWPLERFEISGFRIVAAKDTTLARLVLEKVPLIIMALGVTAATVVGQSRTAMMSVSSMSWPARLSNAIISYGTYIAQMFWPVNLTALYPLPRHPLYAQAAIVLLILLAITLAVLYYGRRHRYLLVGWLWYIVTLLPVIGIIQVGRQAHADRYTYIPLVGLFVIIIWGAADISARLPRLRVAFSAAITAAILILAGLTYRAVDYWQSSETLLQQAMSVCKDNYVWRANWATILSDFGRNAEAVAILEDVVRQCAPDDRTDALNSLGSVLARMGRTQDALERFRQAAAFRPNDALSWYNVGTMLIILNRPQEALEPCRHAVDIDHYNPKSRLGLGMAMAASGDIDGGIVELKKATELDPGLASAYVALGRAYAVKGDWAAAAAEFQKSLAMQHDYASLVELAGAQQHLNDWPAAAENYRMAVALQPSNAMAHLNYAAALAQLKNEAAAKAELRLALTLNPSLRDSARSIDPNL
jgi:protein O-mannosyl-transferase